MSSRTERAPSARRSASELSGPPSSLRSCVHDRVTGITVRIKTKREAHRAHHSHHPLTNVVGDDGLDLMVLQEASDASVMASGRAFVVQAAPRDFHLLPRRDLPVHDFCDGYAISSSPARIDRTVFVHGHTKDHERRLSPRDHIAESTRWNDPHCRTRSRLAPSP